MLTTIATFLLGGLGWLKDAISGLLQWVKENPWQAATFLFIALSVLFWRGIQNEKQRTADAWEAANAERASHRATKASYRHAQAEAAEQDRLNKLRVEKEYAHILEVAQSRYAADLSAARHGFAERLRTSQTRTCSVSGGSGEAMSETPVLSSGSMQAGGDAIVSSADAELGLENSIRLQALIEAWKNVAAVEVNAP